MQERVSKTQRARRWQALTYDMDTSSSSNRSGANRVSDSGLFRFQSKAVHDDRLIDLAVGVVAADVAKDEDPAVHGLHRAGIIGRAGNIKFVPRLAGIA